MTPDPRYPGPTIVFTCAGCQRALRQHKLHGRLLGRPFCAYCYEAAEQVRRVLGDDAILNQGRWNKKP